MTIYDNNKQTYFCKVIETNEIVYFYITQDMNITNEQSINIKISPFTKTGYTQNLGRGEIKITMNIMVVDTVDSTMEEKYKKLFKLKEQGAIVNLSMPNLPDATNNYQISSISQGLKEPNRLNINISFIEDLPSAIKEYTQDLIGNAALTNITNTLKDRGYVNPIVASGDATYISNQQSSYFR
jgi:hypothetical protein